MHGLFEWVDVSVPDLEAGAAFYSTLFGWTTEPPAGGDGADYLMCRKDGRLAAGIVRSPGLERGQWNSYVVVDSVDAIAERVGELGGTVLVAPMEVGEQGRMTYVEDLQGARLGFWEPATHQGAEAFNEPGFLTWNEIRTHVKDEAFSFYSALMPEWSFHDFEVEGGFYTMVKLGERDNAAIASLSDKFADVPPHWVVWFTVEDAESDVARIEALGGAALGPVVQTSYGPAARVADPFGAPFFIIGPQAHPSE
jgi:predicted enzyme related to lactoylglutathione lyase